MRTVFFATALLFMLVSVQARASEAGAGDAGTCPSACLSTGTDCLTTGSTRGSSCGQSADCCCSTSDPTCVMFTCVPKGDAGADAGNVCCPPVPTCASAPVPDGVGCFLCRATIGATCNSDGVCGASEFCYGSADGGTGMCCPLSHDCFYGTMIGTDGCPECSPMPQDAGGKPHDGGNPRDAAGGTPHDAHAPGGDAPSDGGAVSASTGGCSCRTSTQSSTSAPLGLVALGLLAASRASRRKTR